MAETLISPGVLALENDQSFISQQPVVVGAALIGPTVKGPVEVPTIVTSYSDYQNKFGTTFLSASQVYTYFTSGNERTDGNDVISLTYTLLPNGITSP